MQDGASTASFDTVLADPEVDLLHGLATDAGGVADRYVAKLRTDDYDIGNFLAEVNVARSALLGDHVSRDAAAALDRLDAFVADCLSRTSLIHERAIESMLVAFCELTPAGVIAYANNAMQRLLPGCEGTLLSDHFGRQGGIVADLLGDGRCGIHELEIDPDGPVPRPVCIEIGQVREGGAAFAIINDLSGQRQAEQLVYSLASFPVVSLAPDLTLAYANAAAEALLGLPMASIRGHSALEFIRPADRELVRTENLKRRGGMSSTYMVHLMRPYGKRDVKVRLVVLPRYNGLNEYVGLLVTIHSLEAETTYRAIMRLVTAAGTAEELWSGMLEALRDVFDFDVASLTFYTPDDAYGRAELAWPQPLMREFYRWFPVPKVFRDGIKTAHWHPNLEQYIRERPGGEEVLRTPSLKALLKAGIKPFVTLPVWSAPGMKIGFSLLSRTPGAFDDSTVDHLRELGVQAALAAILQRFEAERGQFTLDLLRAMAEARDIPDLASAVLERVRVRYGWDHASLFKINAVCERFELIAQAYAHEGMRLPAGLTQPLADGLLGLAYAKARDPSLKNAERVVRYSALDPDSADGRHHRRGCPETRSEMCGAVSLESRPVWILNLEDARDNAFMSVDAETLSQIIGQLEESARRAFHESTLIQILDVMQDGVITTDLKGRIIGMNRKARMMFTAAGLEPSGQDHLLSDDLDDLAAQAISDPPSRTPIEAVLGNGERRVLLTTATLDDSYDHRVILLADVQQDQWSHGVQVMIKAVQEVIATTLRPRSIAKTLLSEIETRAAKGPKSTRPIGEMASRAMEQLDKLAIGYDTILRSDAIARFDESPDLGMVLKEVVGRLPAARQGGILLDIPGELPRTGLAAAPLATILSGMLARMIDLVGEGMPLTVQARASRRWTLVKMQGRPRPGATLMAPSAAEEDDHLRSLRRMVRQYGGNVRSRILETQEEELALGLPVMLAAAPLEMEAVR